MKKAVLSMLVVFLATINVSAQTAKPATITRSEQYEHKVDSLLAEIDSLLDINNQLLEVININTSLKERYKLYQTENIYTLLQLDTKTGMIEQVQWSLDSENEGSVTMCVR